MYYSRFNAISELANDLGYVIHNLFHGAASLVSPETAAQLAAKDIGGLDICEQDGLRRGKFILSSVEEEQGLISELEARFLKSLDAVDPLRHYQILLTYDCNLACPYCFEKKLRSPGLLTLEQLERALEVISDVDGSSAANPNCEKDVHPTITLSGGEPLQPRGASVPLLLRVVQFCTSRGFRYRIVTNGVTLTQYLPVMLNAGRPPEQLQITLDGPREIHNARRSLVNGEGSFDAITEGIDHALDAGIRVVLRVNVDSLNVDSVAGLASLIEAKRWQERGLKSYLAPVSDHTGVNGDYGGLANSAVLLARVMKQMCATPELGRFLPPKGFRGFAAVQRALSSRGVPAPSFWRCEAIMGQLVFDPRGDIYPCPETVGADGKIGEYLPQFALDPVKQRGWRRLNSFAGSLCINCNYRFICGGGCGAAMMRFGRGACLPIEREIRMAWRFYSHVATGGALPRLAAYPSPDRPPT